MNNLQTALTIYRKEIVDALRDRRTLAIVLVSSVLMGPLVLLAISGLVASLESRADRREVYVSGLAHAPRSWRGCWTWARTSTAAARASARASG